jgi:hypothetical protein
MLTKIGWATFWLLFSHTRLVTLLENDILLTKSVCELPMTVSLTEGIFRMVEEKF